MEDKLKCEWWETAIEIISSISFSQMEPSSVEYIVRKLQNILKDDNLDNIIDRIKSSIGETENNVGFIAEVIFNILSKEHLTNLREKVSKNENFCDYITDLVFELDFKGEISNDKFIKKED